MKLRDFIRDQFKRRLEATGCLVIYDGDDRYGECAADLAGDTCAFIDTGESIITARVGVSPGERGNELKEDVRDTRMMPAWRDKSGLYMPGRRIT